MSYKLSILIALAFISCGQPSKITDSVVVPTSAVVADSIPAGFSIVEKQPDGYFIRLSSAERATPSAIRSIADTFPANSTASTFASMSPMSAATSTPLSSAHKCSITKTITSTP